MGRLHVGRGRAGKLNIEILPHPPKDARVNERHILCPGPPRFDT